MSDTKTEPNNDIGIEFMSLIQQMTLAELERLYREGLAIKEAHQNACKSNASDLQFGYLDDSLPGQQIGSLGA